MKRPLGIALVTTLIFCSLLLAMVTGLFIVLRGELWLSRAHRDQVAALYLAELAVHDAMVALEADPAWTEGFQDKTVPSVAGSYSISFPLAGDPLTSLDSINNFDGQSGDSHHGDDTVPRGHALIIASARVGNSLRVVEALVHIGGGLYDTELPLMNDGYVALRGNVTIDGVRSISDGTAVPGGLHSNLNSVDADLVSLIGPSPYISGRVSSSGSSAGAINLGGYSPGLGTETNAAQIAMQEIDIINQIAQKSGAPSPPALPIGTTTLTGGPDFYHNGDLVLNGALELDGVNLYVNGNLTVNGAITGNGSVYVAQKTNFKGSAKVTTATPERVALYSHGSVELSGFDGTAFLDALAASDPAAADHWSHLKTHLRDFETEANRPNMRMGQGSPIDDIRGYIGGGAGGEGPMHNRAGKLQRLVDAQPPSAARDFVSDRLGQLNSLFYGELNGNAKEDAALQMATSGYLLQGGIDALIDNSESDDWGLVQSFIQSLDFDHAGSAYFQGLVYTHGFVHASSEITVVGAAISHRATVGPPVPPEVIGPDTLNPGDVYLLDGTRVVYVEEFFKPAQAGGGTGGGGARLVTWMGR